MTDPMDELRQASADLQQMENLTPPPELVQQWVTEAHSKDAPPGTCPNTRIIINRAVEWAANAELNACCFVLEEELSCFVAPALRAARRPKPPSLAEEALKAMGRYKTEEWCEELTHDGNIILRALKRLQELEEQQ